jgi:hypothetical protein
MLEAAVASLEPQPTGRPPQAASPEAARMAELEAEIHRLAQALRSRSDEPSPRRKKKKPRKRRA